MEFFKNAKAVRLRSHLGKYLVAEEEEETTVRQSRNGSSQRARWAVETITGKSDVIRLKSCHGRYLTASDESSLLGMTGKKVVLDLMIHSSTEMNIWVEWEPLKEGSLVKLRTKASGKFLRANGGTPPWRNSVTHDVPHRTATQDWILWNVEVVDIILSTDDSNSKPSSSLISSSLPDDEESIYIGSINRIGSHHRQLVSSYSNSPSLKNENESSPTRRSKSRLSSMFSRTGSGSNPNHHSLNLSTNHLSSSSSSLSSTHDYVPAADTYFLIPAPLKLHHSYLQNKITPLFLSFLFFSFLI